MLIFSFRLKSSKGATFSFPGNIFQEQFRFSAEVRYAVSTLVKLLYCRLFTALPRAAFMQKITDYMIHI